MSEGVVLIFKGSLNILYFHPIYFDNLSGFLIRTNFKTQPFKKKMPYLIVRESHVTDTCLVEGLPLNEIRLVTDRSSSSSELKDEKNRRVEFHTAATDLLSALEHFGYKVVTSSDFVTGQKEYSSKDFIWTLYKQSKYDIEM